MERGGQAGAAEPRRPGTLAASDRYVEPWLELDLVGDPEAVEQPQVGGAAAEEDVLAVVDLEPVALDGERRTAEPRPRFVQRHGRACVREIQRRRDPREPAAHHEHGAACCHAGAHDLTPAREASATRAFSPPLRESLRS